jgi:hypothetical protein
MLSRCAGSPLSCCSSPQPPVLISRRRPVSPRNADVLIEKLAATEPVLLACMHGASYLAPADRARSLVLQRMLEEHYHQVFEYELAGP